MDLPKGLCKRIKEIGCGDVPVFFYHAVRNTAIIRYINKIRPRFHGGELIKIVWVWGVATSRARAAAPLSTTANKIRPRFHGGELIKIVWGLGRSHKQGEGGSPAFDHCK